MKTRKADDKKKRGLVFYIQPLDANTNRCIAEMKKSFERHFRERKEKNGNLCPIWECEYEDAAAIIKSQKTLDLKFKIWLLSSDGRFLDRRGEFFFKNLKKETIEGKVKKEILKIKSAMK